MAAPAQVSLKRQQADVRKLIATGRAVVVDEASVAKGSLEFYVNDFKGPAGTPYEEGTFKVFVHLPTDYPFRSPSIGFRTPIFHPNVDWRSGSVCLDVINQAWSPLFDLSNVFDSFLPQLLQYGNADDPLNGEAAALMRDPDRYAARVKEYVIKYAAASSTSSRGAGGGVSATAATTTTVAAPTGAARGTGSGAAGAGAPLLPLSQAGSTAPVGAPRGAAAARVPPVGAGSGTGKGDDDDDDGGSVAASDVSELSEL